MIPPVPVRVIILAALLLGCMDTPAAPAASADPNDLLIVDCALPGQIRQLGRATTYVAPRVPERTTALDCRTRGGEYVVHDRASLATSLAVWLARATEGDLEAQTIVGELFERGAGTVPDYAAAAQWYRRAAQAGFARAQVNLGNLYERGLGVAPDPHEALSWYRRAAGLPEAIELETGPDVAPFAAPGLLAGPEIVLIEPQLGATRGLVRVDVAVAGGTTQRVVGRASAAAGVLTVSVNGAPAEMNPAGVFIADVALRGDRTDVLVTAIDEHGKRADLRFALAGATDGATGAAPAPSGPEPPLVLPGTDYALLIGNQDYAHLPRLFTPIADVDRIEAVLRERYGFRTRTLYNASRYDTLSALNDLRGRLTSEDRLLVYYAGHGELDVTNMRGHWLPVDAEPGNTANWLSNVDVTDILNVIRARQVLLVVDSCYSGTLTRSSLSRLDVGLTSAERATWLQLMAEKRARVVLTSGGLAPVLDFGGGAHSVFARSFIDALESNGEVLLGRTLFQAVAARVAHAAAGYDFEQIPQYAPIGGAGHEAGDFILRPTI
jgi:uncharacterized protein